MASSTSHTATQQHHEFVLPLTDGEVDLEQLPTEDLTRFVTVVLGILAERKEAEQR